MLDSFVSTQKQSVQKAMQKKFRKFITSKVLRAPATASCRWLVPGPAAALAGLQVDSSQHVWPCIALTVWQTSSLQVIDCNYSVISEAIPASSSAHVANSYCILRT